jgi:3-oxoacyl-[acyl-carrier-protein] synthase III
MAFSTLANFQVKGVATCVPPQKVQNATDVPDIDGNEIRKVVAMAGVQYRHVSDGSVTSTDLCRQASEQLLAALGWTPETVDGLILVTQTPDYFLPSSSCLVHKDLGFGPDTATFDVGLGCSGYPYGLWLGAMMLNSGLARVLVLHGDTPSLFCHPKDQATTLLFGDAGSATALEKGSAEDVAHFSLHSDGQGYADLILPGGAFRDRAPKDERDKYLRMNGANVFAFTLKRVPSVFAEILSKSGVGVDDVDHFVFHQSNRFIMQHLARKLSLDVEKFPIILGEYGNTGGPSIPLTMTRGLPAARKDPATLLSIGYGVGLSWSASIFDLPLHTPLLHSIYQPAAHPVD